MKKLMKQLFLIPLLMMGLQSCSSTALNQAASQETDQKSSATAPDLVWDLDIDYDSFDPDDVPQYDGNPVVEVNNNVPWIQISAEDFESFEFYGDLDELGRCTVAESSVGQDLMPTEKRGSISSVYPTGWNNNPYDFVDGGYLYNRSHLIGFQLTGENANENNLITGTRYMNTQGMLPYENEIADYVKTTGNHVLYRVTPIFEGDELVARGVLMEAVSVEDGGEGLSFNVYAYNVQPGIVIDYQTGENWEDYTLEEDTNIYSDNVYVLNTRTKKIHLETCTSVANMSENNREVTTMSIQELEGLGYTKCSICLSD